MKMERHIRGSAVVAQISEISPWEAELILNLRLWQDGETGQRMVWESYARAFGPKEGRVALDRFAGLVFTIEANMLRPLMRHGVTCTCVGSDEAVFANMVRLAAAGEIHEASLIATLMVRAPHAEMVALMAAEVGRALQTHVRPQPSMPANRTGAAQRIH